MRIAILNRSARVPRSDAIRMTAAVAQQLAQHVAPAWGLAVPQVGFSEDPAAIPPGAAVVVLLDQADEPGVLGYHDDSPVPAGKIFVSPILDAGGTILGDAFGLGRPATSGYAVSSTLSHELIELLVDPDVNLYADGPMRGEGSEYAVEAADPCEDGAYEVDGVQVSNFVLPSWFDPQHAGGPTDYLDQLAGRAFGITPGGYMVIRKGPGQEQQVFGARMPGWRRVQKASAFRMQRRQAAFTRRTA